MTRRNLPPSRRPLRDHLRARPGVERIEPRTLLSTFTVTSTGNAGVGTLRQAILDANDNSGTDTIAFAIDSGAQTIRPTSALPTITDPVSLDAATQPSYAGSPLIELSGNLAGQGVDGLRVAAGGSTIRGLVIANFQGAALRLEGKDGNRVDGNFFGTDVTGSMAQGNGGSGIVISGSSGNTIGGTSLGNGNGNVIAANTGYGLDIGEATVSPTTTNT